MVDASVLQVAAGLDIAADRGDSTDEAVVAEEFWTAAAAASAQVVEVVAVMDEEKEENVEAVEEVAVADAPVRQPCNSASAPTTDAAAAAGDGGGGGARRRRRVTGHAPRWTAAEEATLAEIVIKCAPAGTTGRSGKAGIGWQGIADRLGTGRSGYAVEQHYRLSLHKAAPPSAAAPSESPPQPPPPLPPPSSPAPPQPPPLPSVPVALVAAGAAASSEPAVRAVAVPRKRQRGGSTRWTEEEESALRQAVPEHSTAQHSTA